MPRRCQRARSLNLSHLVEENCSVIVNRSQCVYGTKANPTISNFPVKSRLSECVSIARRIGHTSCSYFAINWSQLFLSVRVICPEQIGHRLTVRRDGNRFRSLSIVCHMFVPTLPTLPTHHCIVHGRYSRHPGGVICQKPIKIDIEIKMMIRTSGNSNTSAAPQQMNQIRRIVPLEK